MTNKFYINLTLIFFCFFSKPLLFANELNINAETIEIDKSNQVVRAEGNVEIIDSKNDIINS